MNQHTLVEHLFRHEYGLLVALLLRRFGAQHLDAIEDAVQYATTQALDIWVRTKQPDNPSGWLYKVACRQLLSELRNSSRRRERLSEQQAHNTEMDSESYNPELPLKGEMTDALLRMLFVACDDAIPTESQLVFTLKALCGFNVKEIALRLFTTEENVYKRFARARQHLKNNTTALATLTDSTISARLPVVLKVLYLVFTEGYLSSQSDMAIRRDLCEEAIRLTGLLSSSTLGSLPEVHALLALMYLHFARLSTRQNDGGELLLFEQQKRELWDKKLIATGLYCLQESAQGDTLSRYHVEASIAAEHCMALSFEETRWDRIVQAYERLEHMSQSPLMRLNKVIAMAEWLGPEAALAELQLLELPVWLERSYYWYAVQADLLQRCGQHIEAQQFAQLAIKYAPTRDIQNLLYKRFEKSLSMMSKN